MTDPEAVFRTAELLRDSEKYLAYGTELANLRPLFHGTEGVYPHFIESTDGCRLIDTTGRTYIDWTSGFGAVLFGYGDPEVAEAAREVLDFGPTLSMPHALEVEVASLIVATVPCAEKVSFGKNGSDAVAAAVRIARSATERDIVLIGGYHGFHDWYQASNPDIRGIPKLLRRTVRPFPYNDLGFVERMFHQQRDRIAAIVVEPTRSERPAEGYLEGLRVLADRHGALLVFDEVVTGFRLANGGAQELYGVTPDLGCISKSLAHGFPLSAVVGAAEPMGHYPRVGAGMTFRNEAVALAVARHVLRRLREQPVAERLASVGEQLRSEFDGLCQRLGIAGRLSGHPALLHLRFEDHDDVTGEVAKGMFMDEALKAGLVTNGAFIPTGAHDQQAIDLSFEIFERALTAMASRVGAGGDTAPAAAIPWVQGCFDFVEESEEGDLRAVGWLLCETGPSLSVHLITRSAHEVEATPLWRPDVADRFPHSEGARRSGFEGIVPHSSFELVDDRSFLLEGRRDGEPFFRCLVSCERLRSRAPGPIPIHQGQHVILDRTPGRPEDPVGVC